MCFVFLKPVGSFANIHQTHSFIPDKPLTYVSFSLYLAQPARRRKLIFGNASSNRTGHRSTFSFCQFERSARPRTHANDRTAAAGGGTRAPASTGVFWTAHTRQQHRQAGGRSGSAAISPATSNTLLIIHTQARRDCRASNNTSSSCLSLRVPGCSPREAAHVREHSLKHKG